MVFLEKVHNCDYNNMKCVVCCIHTVYAAPVYTSYKPRSYMLLKGRMQCRFNVMGNCVMAYLMWNSGNKK